MGDTIVESGAVITTQSTTKEADGSLVVSFKGKLSADVSFVEWELQPDKSYAERMVFLISAEAQPAYLTLS